MYLPAAAAGRRLGTTIRYDGLAEDKSKYFSKFYEEEPAVLLPSVSDTDSELYYLHVLNGDSH